MLQKVALLLPFLGFAQSQYTNNPVPCPSGVCSTGSTAGAYQSNTASYLSACCGGSIYTLNGVTTCSTQATCTPLQALPANGLYTFTNSDSSVSACILISTDDAGTGSTKVVRVATAAGGKRAVKLLTYNYNQYNAATNSVTGPTGSVACSSQDTTGSCTSFTYNTWYGVMGDFQSWVGGASSGSSKSTCDGLIAGVAYTGDISTFLGSQYTPAATTPAATAAPPSGGGDAPNPTTSLAEAATYCRCNCCKGSNTCTTSDVGYPRASFTPETCTTGACFVQFPSVCVDDAEKANGIEGVNKPVWTGVTKSPAGRVSISSFVLGTMAVVWGVLCVIGAY